MKKLGRSTFPLLLAAVLVLGVMTLYTAPAQAHLPCPIYKCPSGVSPGSCGTPNPKNVWCNAGCCTKFHKRTSSITIHPVYIKTSNSGVVSLCYGPGIEG